MAQPQRRPQHRVSSVIDHHSLLARRKLQARRTAAARRRVFSITNSYTKSTSSHDSVASGSPPASSRQVLVFNLRRLPSRLFSDQSQDMQDAVTVGSKRKRVASGNENVRGPSRSGSRVKRQRSSRESSDDETVSSMEVDKRSQWTQSDGSGDEEGEDSSDNYLINEAPPRQLLRLRKDELVRLYIAAGLTEDAELLTKPEIVDCIIAARDDLASLPPSSPTGADSGSSDYSSDGGNIAGGEETDFSTRARNGLKRRVTTHELGRSNGRSLVNRSYSLPQIQMLSQSETTSRSGRRVASNASSSRSSPTTSVASSSILSPPAKHTRSQKLSSDNTLISISPARLKGKGKQVEFRQGVEVVDFLPDVEEESDLTDLTEIEDNIAQSTPKPRRHRGKGDKTSTSEDYDVHDPMRRITPMRKAKGKVGSLKEDTDEEDDLEEVPDSEGDEEVDELESPTETPKATMTVHRTPLRHRLRSRTTQRAPPSDGDDEGSEGESAIVEGSVDGEDEGIEELLDEDAEGEEAPLSQPKVLRSGKVIGDGEVEEDVSILDEDEEDEEADEDEDIEEAQDDAASVDLEGGDTDEEVADGDEPMEDDIDLTIATAKTLVRLRRDDLVRLCEYREIDTIGTKPQLAQALLQWRDRHCSEAASSPSSTGTARPPSTTRPSPKRRKTRSEEDKVTPVLLRSDKVHIDEPLTPPLTAKAKEAEPELELDLESLGLDDREIPPEKLMKLEKIGSGGFKDVFIGKFKGRRVAIAEFRGQLNAMDVKELKLLGDFDHPNIVRFLGVSVPLNTRDTPVMIVSELCSNGDLFDYIRNVDPPTLYRVLCIMLDIARGIEYLHMRKPSIIHRDCKSSNILITSKGVAKITDFGLAKVKQSTRSMVRSLVGTVNWQAPELWHAHPKYNHKVDVFSCGMVFWEILQWHLPNKKFPWEGMNEHAIYDLVGSKHQRPSLHGLKNRWCPEVVGLIERMWAQDHQDRPTMSEVVQELEPLVQKYR